MGHAIKLHFLYRIKTSNTIATEKRAISQGVSYAGLHSLERVTSLLHSDQWRFPLRSAKSGHENNALYTVDLTRWADPK